jgi:hypothetical protein
MSQNTTGWGSTRITFSKEEFDYIYDIVELPSRRNLVSAFDTVWNWEGLGEGMRSHPEALLRWMERIMCSIVVHGRTRKHVFDAIWGNFNAESHQTHIITTTP